MHAFCQPGTLTVSLLCVCLTYEHPKCFGLDKSPAAPLECSVCSACWPVYASIHMTSGTLPAAALWRRWWTPFSSP
eukprot:scaffold131066_cov29-Prasinocladus_malaysianus.AAC.1